MKREIDRLEKIANQEINVTIKQEKPTFFGLGSSKQKEIKI